MDFKSTTQIHSTCLTKYGGWCISNPQGELLGLFLLDFKLTHQSNHFKSTMISNRWFQMLQSKRSVSDNHYIQKFYISREWGLRTHVIFNHRCAINIRIFMPNIMMFLTKLMQQHYFTLIFHCHSEIWIWAITNPIQRHKKEFLMFFSLFPCRTNKPFRFLCIVLLI